MPPCDVATVTGDAATVPVTGSIMVITSPSGSPSLPVSVELSAWPTKLSKLSSEATGGVFSVCAIGSTTSMTSSLATQLPCPSQTSSVIVSSPVKSVPGV